MISESTGAAALVAAHPGHETLLHHWLERARPCVFVLTDGSGGSAEPRTEHSRRLVNGAGGSCGGVFGDTSDRDWYRDVLQGSATRFHAVVERIEAECLERGVTTIVSDPVELFNPMHDLTNAVAHAVGRRLQARRALPVQILTYPIERPQDFAADIALPLALNASAAARKDAAILAYSPLAEEYPRYRDLVTRDHEVLARDEGFSWPATPPEQPYYERFGMQRLRERRYDTLITYATHVRPIAIAVLGANGP